MGERRRGLQRASDREAYAALEAMKDAPRWRRGLRALWRARQDLWLVLLSGILLLTVLQVREEAETRTDGQCTIFEGDHLDDVTALGNAYSYFLTVEQEDYDDAIFKFAVRQLPTIEERAYIDRAPEYCDADGVGFDEPDPELPQRPRGLTERFKLPPLPERHEGGQVRQD